MTTNPTPEARGAPRGAVLHELDPAEYPLLLEQLRGLPMNTLFAQAVLTHDAPGLVLGYPAASPSVGYVLHRYGMSLLFGEPALPALREAIRAQIRGLPRARDEWLQVAPVSWAAQFDPAEPPAPSDSPDSPDSPAPSEPGWPPVERHTRVNFRFSPERYKARRLQPLPAGARIERADRSAFAMPGSVTPSSFFRDADHFQRAGTAFAVIIDGVPASLAFSAFTTETQLEIGIETLPAHRGRSLAALACAALIDECLMRGLEPIWACRLENVGSHRLAEALGFEPVRHLPYFRLRAAASG